MAVNAGTAYVDVKGDFSALNSQIDSALAPITSKFEGKFGKLGKAAAVGLAGVGVAAVAAGKALYDIGEQFDSAYDTISAGTGATGKRLDGLKDDFRDVVKSVPTDFGSAADAITQLNQRLGISGKPLREMSKQMLELSRITDTDLTGNIEAATRTFGDWGIKVGQQPAFLDKMFRASQRTGISVKDLGEQLVRYGAPLRQMGFGFSEAAAMVGKFEKEGVNAQLVMGSLRIALGKMATEGVEDPSKALEILTDRIKNAGSAGEANKLALETFGARAGPDMAAAIREGRFEFDKLVAGIDKGKSTIIGTGKDTQDFSEKWQMFKNRVLVALEPLATRVFNAIGDAMGFLATKDFSPALAKGATALRDIRGAISPLIAAFNALRPLIAEVARSIAQGFQGAFTIIRGVVQVFSGLFQGDFSKMWNGIKLIFKGGWDVILGGIRAVTAPIRFAAAKVGQGIVSAFNVVKQIPGKVAGFFTDLVAKIGSFAGQVFDKAKTVGGRIVDGIASAVKGLPDAVVSAIGSVGAIASDIGSAIRDWINDNTIFGDNIHIDLPGPKNVDFTLPALASGAQNFSGWAVVGEEGPELAHFPRIGGRGADIYSNRVSQRMLAGQSVPQGRGSVEAHFHTPGSGNPDPGVFFAQFNAFARAKGLV